jgi:pimeloyl-ACP methyl ester carboxylesterase
MISLIVPLSLGVLAIASAIGTRLIEKDHPPSGRFVQVDGGRLHVIELGPTDAPPVVLLHGASGNLGDLRFALGDRLSEHYRIILVDRPGHGWSDRPDGRMDSSPERQATLIHQALSRMGVKRPILVGHSWSGALATAYSLAYPNESAGLVLLAPVTHPWRGGVGWINDLVTIPLIGQLIAHTFVLPIGYFTLPAAVASVFAPQTPPAGYVDRTDAIMILRPSEFIANAQDLVDLKAHVTTQAPHYGEINVPVAIIADDADDIVSTDIHSRALFSMLAQATLTVLPGVGHMVQYAALDRVIQAVNEVATAFRRSTAGTEGMPLRVISGHPDESA